MNHDIERIPGGDPTGGDDAARDFQQALADPDLAQKVRLHLDISGGSHGERYELRFDSTADDTARIAFINELTGRRYEEQEVKLPPDTTRQLLNRVDVNRMISFHQANVPIPPCSLVAKLEISYGDRSFRVIFMADEEQARTAGYRIPEAFQDFLNAIYAIAAQQIGTDRIRP